MATTPAQPPVLELDRATAESHAGYDCGLYDVSLTLAAGDLALVRLEADGARSPLADAASGVIDLESGAARFAGEDWSRMSLNHSARCRGRIGRTFEGHAWVSNLDVDENVLLAARHHTGRADADLAEEAASLARQFGLPGLPRGRPNQTRRQDLQRAALVRAFLGSPTLLILERPEHGVYPQVMASLTNAVRAACRRGAAVLWLTNHADVWQDPGVRPTARYAASGSQVLPAGRDGIGSGGVAE
jgi:phospholipid/cholesterol/gamma-HCH transport system ATP-binding protein